MMRRWWWLGGVVVVAVALAVAAEPALARSARRRCRPQPERRSSDAALVSQAEVPPRTQVASVVPPGEPAKFCPVGGEEYPVEITYG